jgi:hypothetical protein
MQLAICNFTRNDVSRLNDRWREVENDSSYTFHRAIVAGVRYLEQAFPGRIQVATERTSVTEYPRELEEEAIAHFFYKLLEEGNVDEAISLFESNIKQNARATVLLDHELATQLGNLASLPGVIGVFTRIGSAHLLDRNLISAKYNCQVVNDKFSDGTDVTNMPLEILMREMMTAEVPLARIQQLTFAQWVYKRTLSRWHRIRPYDAEMYAQEDATSLIEMLSAVEKMEIFLHDIRLYGIKKALENIGFDKKTN